jgi:hypothetical protein
MSQLRHNHFKEGRLGRTCTAMVMLLCLCIMGQRLDVPVTPLNPGAAADSPALSVSQGFSVPSSLPQLTASAEMVQVIDAQPSVHLPVLAAAPFHPPIL